MAAVTDSQYYTDQVGGSNGDTRVKTYPRAQDLRIVRIRRDLTGTESASDTFNLFKMKKGQVLVPGASWITHDDAGTTLTIDIGDAGDADRYADGADLASAAGLTQFVDSAIPDGEDNPYEVEEDNVDVVVTIATSGTPAAASVVFYLAILDQYQEA